MSLISKKLFNIPITISSESIILEEVRKYFKNSKMQNAKSKKQKIKPLIIFTPNPEIISFALKHPWFKEIVTSAQINIADGWGIVWALKRFYQIKISKISGVDLMNQICQLANKNAFIIGLIGGRDNLALNVKECLSRKYPGLKVEVLEEPEITLRIKNKEFRIKNRKNINDLTSYFLILDSKKKPIKTEDYFRNLVKEIGGRKIDILFVALGFPKQEWFIKMIRNQLSNARDQQPIVLMAVGGTFDYLAGRVKRAPEWMRTRGIEWIYRLVNQPWRLPRQLKGALFFWKALKESLTSNKHLHLVF